jgi:hypothetical protein
VSTFGKWAESLADPSRVMDYPERQSMIVRIRHSLSLDSKFLASEVVYATGDSLLRASGTTRLVTEMVED